MAVTYHLYLPTKAELTCEREETERMLRALEILAEFRRLLATPEVSTRIDVIAERVAAITGVISSRVRILDELIWFDWNLRPPDVQGLCQVVGFPDWVYDTAQDGHGVYRLLSD